jgi:hypothetical protein
MATALSRYPHRFKLCVCVGLCVVCVCCVCENKIPQRGYPLETQNGGYNSCNIGRICFLKMKQHNTAQHNTADQDAARW